MLFTTLPILERPLVQNLPPTPSQPGAKVSSGGGRERGVLSWAPFHISSASSREESLGTKVGLCIGPVDRPPLSSSTSSDPFSGQRASSLERAGVTEGITGLPYFPPLPIPGIPSALWAAYKSASQAFLPGAEFQNSSELLVQP